MSRLESPRSAGVLVLLVAQPGEDPTELEKRRRVFLTVNRYPGLTLAEMARQADVDESLARYHVRVLEDASLVRSEDEGGHRRIFPLEKTKVGAAQKLDDTDRRWISLLRRPPILRAVVAILHAGPLNAGELAQACGVARSTASSHIARMEEGELVTIEREGRSRVISLTDRERALGLLAEHPPPDDIVEDFVEAWDDLGL